ncbi:MAG TPA: response regulator [Stellaceae bacterium]|jgi:CheY-like chemotaxis protein|nr:response regulator [Stellaceae bacterium]
MPAASSSDTVRILLVDDDEAFRYALAKSLREKTFDVVEASSFRDTLPALENGERFDFFVTDLFVPEVHGFALARMARMKHPNIHCIYITAHDVPTDEAIGPILKKPFDTSVLIETIEKLHGAPRASGDAS